MMKAILSIALMLVVSSAAHAGMVDKIERREGMVPSVSSAKSMLKECKMGRLLIEKKQRKPALSEIELARLKNAEEIVGGWGKQIRAALADDGLPAESLGRGDLEKVDPVVAELGVCITNLRAEI